MKACENGGAWVPTKVHRPARDAPVASCLFHTTDLPRRRPNGSARSGALRRFLLRNGARSHVARGASFRGGTAPKHGPAKCSRPLENSWRRIAIGEEVRVEAAAPVHPEVFARELTASHPRAPIIRNLRKPVFAVRRVHAVPWTDIQTTNRRVGAAKPPVTVQSIPGPRIRFSSVDARILGNPAFAFSGIGLDATRSSAFLYTSHTCGSVCGSGSLVTLRRTGGRWVCCRSGDAPSVLRYTEARASPPAAQRPHRPLSRRWCPLPSSRRLRPMATPTSDAQPHSLQGCP